MSSSSSQRARLDVTCPTFDLLTQRYRHSQISWPQSNCCPPPRTLACRRHLTGRDAGPAALGILTAAAACPLPCRASVQMTQQNSEEQSTQTEFAARLPDFQDPQSPPECALAQCPHSRGADCPSLASQCPVRTVQRIFVSSFSFPAALIYQA